MGSMKIILAEDHHIVRAGVKSLLEALGHEVVAEAKNVDELDLLLENTQADLLVTDLGMPGKDIFEVLSAKLQSDTNMKILVLTGMNAAESYKRLIDLGVHGLILKNAFTGDLDQAIQTIVDGQPYIQTEIKRLVSESHHDLTRREIEVLLLLGNAKSNKDIAEELGLSVKTVENHRNKVLQKLDARSLVEAIHKAKKLGIG